MRPRAALLLATGTCLVLAALASLGSSPVDYRLPTPTPHTPLTGTTWTIPLPPDPAPPPEASAGFTLFTIVIAVAALVLFLVLLVQHLLNWRPKRRRATERSGWVEAVVPGPPPPELVTGARRALSDLSAPEAGPPGDAVVAAWLALERAASASGVARAPHETATEFTTALLDRHHVDPAATTALRRTYQRARFGSAEVTEADVRTATTALEAVVRDLTDRDPS